MRSPIFYLYNYEREQKFSNKDNDNKANKKRRLASDVSGLHARVVLGILNMLFLYITTCIWWEYYPHFSLIKSHVWLLRLLSPYFTDGTTLPQRCCPLLQFQIKYASE